jgi:hydrogenase nickel incorporation protein HypA/HybF
MHELSIAQALVEQVEKVVSAEGALRANKVVIAVGALSGADPDAIQGAFPLVAEGTAAAGATLVVEAVEARLRCLACGRESAADRYFVGCGACGARDVELISGRELYLRSVELEVEER